MSYAEKVVEIMKTRKGKLFTLLLVLTVIFTFTGIAYGTSDSGKDLEDQLAQSEDVVESTVEDEQEVDAEKGDVDPVEGEDVDEQDEEASDEATDEPEVDLAVPRVVTDGVVVFEVDNAEQADVFYGDTVAPASLTVDPEGITEASPFVFSVIPAEGYEIDEVSFVSKFNERAKPFVPEENGAVEGDDVKGVPVEELSETLAAALNDTTEKEDVLEADPNLSEDGGSIYSIDDMAIFAGRDVTISIKTKEVQYDAWYKVVDALAAGNSVKLTHDLVAGEDPQIEGATPEQIDRNKQPAIVKEGSNVTLDLNGHSVVSKINDKGALIQAKGANTTLTITDPNSTPIYGGSGSAEIFAEDAGKLASWDSSSRTLTYYLTDTLTTIDSSVESCLTMSVKVPDNAGTITGSQASLVSGDTGATVNIEGGMFSTSNIAMKLSKATFNMTGGYIVGCSITGDNGAGINAANSNVTIAGTAVVAGNTVTASNAGIYGGGDGGGIAIFATDGSETTTTISGDAIIAGNKAKGLSDNAYNRPKTGIGGGIYTRTTNGSDVKLNVNGKAVIAGNEATFDGGGIYHMQGELNLGGSAFITNNVAATGQEETKSNGSSYPVHYGGGGIFSLDLVKIGGSVKVTSNKAGGSGGGLLMASQDNQVKAVLKMESGYFAGNLAVLNEGGAMCLTTKGANKKEGSYIYSGYITNNKTATTFDYGGGGVFVTSNGGELYVYNPLVTKNEAAGSGGGVAACQNGIVISSHAAIFDNTAYGADVLGDHAIGGQWPSELGFDKEDNYINSKYAASDFYGAKESIIYNDMLSTDDGVGTYNWKGFMSGSNTTACASAEISKNWNSNNWFTLYNGQGGTIASISCPAYFNNVWVNDTQTRMAINLTKKSLEEAGLTPEEIHPMLNGIELTLHNNGTTSKYKLTVDSLDSNGLTENKSNDVEYYSFQCSLADPDPSSNGGYAYGGNLYNADGSVNTDAWLKWDVDLKANIKSDQNTYEVYTIDEFHQFPPNAVDEDGNVSVSWAEAKRMMGLVAFPSGTDKDNAKLAARLIISGNYSAANGGGIAVNGRTTIGRDPKSGPSDEPDPDDTPKFGSLSINKVFDNAIDQDKAGKATVLFKVNGYLSENHYRADKKNPYYSDVIEINFEVDGDGQIKTKSVTLANLPVGAFFVIEEITDSGFNTTAVDDTVKTITITAGDNGTVNSVEFHNKYDPDKPWNDSIQNNWSKDMTKPDDQGGEDDGSAAPDEE